METSILNTIKKMCGLDPTYEFFDVDIIVHINSAMSVLAQLGLKSNLKSISGAAETWTDYLGESKNLELVKSYIYLKTKSIFDPSASSSIQNALDARATELEWRIMAEADHE